MGQGMRKAEVSGGIVRNVCEVDPENIPAWCADWPDAGEAGPGWRHDGAEFSPPEVAGPGLDALEAALRARRDRALSAGVDVNGLRVQTDDVSQIRITGAALAAQLDPKLKLRWKITGGRFVQFDAPGILAAAQAVRAHVQACYDREAALLEALRAAPDPASVDLSTGWPGGA